MTWQDWLAVLVTSLVLVQLHGMVSSERVYHSIAKDRRPDVRVDLGRRSKS